MLCVATDNADVVYVAVPLERVPVPSVAAPSLKVTVPVGVPDVDGVTVAVKVTDAPNVDGFKLDDTDVVVDALLTTWLKAGDEVDVV